LLPKSLYQASWSTFFFSFGVHAGLHIEGIYSRKKKAWKWWDILSRSNEYHLVIEIFAAHRLSLYVCVNLSPIPNFYIAPSKQDIYFCHAKNGDVLNSSSLTVASIISLRGGFASYNVPWLAGMVCFFVSILWTFFCLNSEHRQQFYIFVILIMFFFTLFLSLVSHLMLLSWIIVEHGCFKWWLLNFS